MNLLRLSNSLRLCPLAMATCLAFGAAPTALAAPFTFANVAGVTGCSPNTSTAVVSCGTVGLGSTGGFANAQYGVVGASASSGSATANVISIAQFGDQTTFFAPPAALTLGITVALDGTITGAGNGAQAGGKFSMSIVDTSCVVQMTQNTPPTPPEAFASKTCFIPVMPNSVNTLGFLGTLEAFAKFGIGVVADFSQTARITAVGFFDANQNLISPVTLIGDSGTTYGASTIQVAVDIKPQGCPNPFNTAAQGNLPVAILGTASFDVTKVDPSTVKLQGVPTLRSSLEDVATPFTGPLVSATSCTSAGPDGFTDMVLHFSDPAVAAALGPVTSGQVLVLTLTGNLLPEFGSTPITGQDVILIVP